MVGELSVKVSTAKFFLFGEDQGCPEHTDQEDSKQEEVAGSSHCSVRMFILKEVALRSEKKGLVVFIFLAEEALYPYQF